MNKIKLSLLAGLIPMLLCTSCATIMHGTRQTIGISSNPSDALVTVDGRYCGKTPLRVDLKRNENHTIRIELDGYSPYEVICTRQMSAWVFGNVVFGGVPGLVIDCLTGGIYRLTPEQIQAELRDNPGMYSTVKGGTTFIGVTLQPKAEWTKIAQMEKLG